MLTSTGMNTRETTPVEEGKIRTVRHTNTLELDLKQGMLEEKKCPKEIRAEYDRRAVLLWK